MTIRDDDALIRALMQVLGPGSDYAADEVADICGSLGYSVTPAGLADYCPPDRDGGRWSIAGVHIIVCALNAREARRHALRDLL
jgi:hypothetical protein